MQTLEHGGGSIKVETAIFRESALMIPLHDCVLAKKDEANAQEQNTPHITPRTFSLSRYKQQQTSKTSFFKQEKEGKNTPCHRRLNPQALYVNFPSFLLKNCHISQPGSRPVNNHPHVQFIQQFKQV